MPTLYALHGFLGQTTDWKELFAKEDLSSSLCTVDLYQSNFSFDSLKAWAGSFNASLMHDSGSKILIGYSLGGRLALHALLDNPNLFDACIIISSHPGISNFEERQSRYLEDCKWANKLIQDPWVQLMEEWNLRNIFDGGKHCFIRHESDYDREKLACTIKSWSLGHQADLKPLINSLDVPILWINGAEDKPYCKLLEGIQLKHSKSKKVLIDHAGHRAPWDNPVLFLEKVREYIKNLTEPSK